MDMAIWQMHRDTGHERTMQSDYFYGLSMHVRDYMCDTGQYRHCYNELQNDISSLYPNIHDT